jgi:uncharacterized protein
VAGVVPGVAREVLPDRLRGLALLGIVVVNAAYLGISADGLTPAAVDGGVNRLTALLVLTFAQAKFYLLFSFLFGYSTAFILRDHSRPHRQRYLRRVLALLVFGLAHAAFFYVGDILITYAVLGLLLLGLSRRSDRALLWWAVAAFVVAVLLLAALAVLAAAYPEEGSGLGGLDVALASGGFAEAALARLEALPIVLFYLQFLQAPMAFAAFVLGLRASRVRLLARADAHGALWRKLAGWGWGLGLPLQAVSAWLQVDAIGAGTPYSVLGALGFALNFSTAPLLTAGYVGSMALLIQRRPAFGAMLAPAGRMSLTVYIGESALMSLVFAGYGLGYFGQWGLFPVVLTGIGSWVLLSVFAGCWMCRFERGPLELGLAWVAGGARGCTWALHDAPSE